MKYALSALAIFCAAIGTSAEATVAGSDVTCAVTGASGLTCSDAGPFEITTGAPDPDVQVLAGPTPLLDIDFMGSWVDITVNSAITSVGFSGGVIELDGFVHSTGATLGIFSFSSNVNGLTADDLSIVAGLLTIDLAGSDWVADSAVGFDLTAPIPASLLLMVSGLGCVALVGRRRAS